MSSMPISGASPRPERSTGEDLAFSDRWSRVDAALATAAVRLRDPAPPSVPFARSRLRGYSDARRDRRRCRCGRRAVGRQLELPHHRIFGLSGIRGRGRPRRSGRRVLRRAARERGARLPVRERARGRRDRGTGDERRARHRGRPRRPRPPPRPEAAPRRAGTRRSIRSPSASRAATPPRSRRTASTAASTSSRARRGPRSAAPATRRPRRSRCRTSWPHSCSRSRARRLGRTAARRVSFGSGAARAARAEATAAEGPGATPAPSAARRAGTRRAAGRTRRGESHAPSKLRGVRLLWEESGFALVGAFCVAAAALGGAWIALESIVGLSSVPAGLMSAAAAGWVLEMVSRHHYADRLPQPSARAKPSSARTVGTVSPAPRARRPARPAAPRPAARSTRPVAPPMAEPRRGAATVAGQRTGSARRAA